jgi:hypothetical protein
MGPAVVTNYDEAAGNTDEIIAVAVFRWDYDGPAGSDHPFDFTDSIPIQLQIKSLAESPLRVRSLLLPDCADLGFYFPRHDRFDFGESSVNHQNRPGSVRRLRDLLEIVRAPDRVFGRRSRLAWNRKFRVSASTMKASVSRTA